MPTFISHSFKDEAVYSTLCLALDAAGVTRWDPASMALGESLSEQLQSALQTCEVCVFIATRRSIESPWCLAELGAFWGSGKKVLMFMADPDLADSTLPPQFKGILRADTAVRLIEAVKRITHEHKERDAHARRNAQSIFFPTSGEYGSEKDWALLLDETEKRFDVCGVGPRSMAQNKRLPPPCPFQGFKRVPSALPLHASRKSTAAWIALQREESGFCGARHSGEL